MTKFVPVTVLSNSARVAAGSVAVPPSMATVPPEKAGWTVKVVVAPAAPLTAMMPVLVIVSRGAASPDGAPTGVAASV